MKKTLFHVLEVSYQSILFCDDMVFSFIYKVVFLQNLGPGADTGSAYQAGQRFEVATST